MNNLALITLINFLQKVQEDIENIKIDTKNKENELTFLQKQLNNREAEIVELKEAIENLKLIEELKQSGEKNVTKRKSKKA